MGYNEWYIFDRPGPVKEYGVVVNYAGYRLYGPVWKWCAERFWNRMQRLRPESYLGDRTVLTFVTPLCFDKVLTAFAHEDR